MILTAEQELTLKGIAYSIKTLLNQEGDGILKEFLYGSIRNLKRIFTALLVEKFNTILTEQDWEWISNTEDSRLIRVLVAKLIIDDASKTKHPKAQSDIRKAILENKNLILKIADYIDDEVTMKQLEKYLDNYT